MTELEHQPRETASRGRELTSVHINLPTRLWRAVGGLARYLGTNKTNIVVRALDNYAYLTQVLEQDRSTKVFIVHGNGDRELVPFPELARAESVTSFGSRAPEAASHATAQTTAAPAPPLPQPSRDRRRLLNVPSRVASSGDSSPLVTSNPLAQALSVSQESEGAPHEGWERAKELEPVG